MRKLSELKDEDVLLVGSAIITKLDVVEDLESIKNNSKCSIYTTTQYKANLKAKDIIDGALEDEYQNMYEDWYEDICNAVTEEDINDIQVVLDRILSRSPERNICYFSGEKVEIDI